MIMQSVLAENGSLRDSNAVGNMSPETIGGPALCLSRSRCHGHSGVVD